MYERLFAGSDRVIVIPASASDIGVPVQLYIFQHFMVTYNHLHRWAMHIDIDEFINLRHFRNVHELAMTYWNGSAKVPDPTTGTLRSVGSLALPWLIFGSGKQLFYRPEPVVTRFTHRAAVHDDEGFLWAFPKIL